MSSIDEKQRRLLLEFYEEHVLALTGHPETANLEPPRRGDEESFFTVRPRSRMHREEFELKVANEAQVIETLEQMWSCTPLAALPRPLMKLAKHFQEREEKAEVSPFIYEMF